MHAIHFQLKRAHLSTTRFAQRAVKRIEGMTPARYDILALLRDRTPTEREPAKSADVCMLPQTDIVAALGLHPSTVSKMLKRMEEMGWVTRKKVWWLKDRRRNVIALTELGFRRAVRAMSRVFQTRAFLAPFERIARQLRPLDHAVDAVMYVWLNIDALARFFDDRSNFFYPFEDGLTLPHLEVDEKAAAPDVRGPRTTWEKVRFQRRAEMMAKRELRMMRNRMRNLGWLRVDEEGRCQPC